MCFNNVPQFSQGKITGNSPQGQIVEFLENLKKKKNARATSLSMLNANVHDRMIRK